MKEKQFPARLDELKNVLSFVSGELEENDCPMKIVMQTGVAVEEIFVNIANYAYGDNEGSAWISVECIGKKAEIIFKDNGTPFDPTSKLDPDVTLSAEQRKIGGLGIYMTKKMMDEMKYEYKEGQNILTLIKNY